MRNPFTVVYFEIDDSKCPVQEFLDSLSNKMSAKMYGMISLLEENGNELRTPYSEHLEDGIFELRAKLGSDITRVLYFFYVGKRIILTHGFVKKTQKTPRPEIERAKKYRKMFLEEMERSDENFSG